MALAAIAAALGGALAGAAHALAGPDHLAAVAPLAATGGRGQGWRLGVRWGLGHSAGVALVAVLALALRDLLPLEALSALGERAVGAVLVGVGVWGFYRLMEGRELEAGGRGGVSAVSIGVLHGAAGSSHLLGVVPALALPVQEAAGWVIGFGAGTVGAMAGFGGVLGGVPAEWQRRAVGVASGAAVGIGVWWMVGGG